MAIDVIFWDFGGVIVKDNVRQAFEGCKVPYDQRARALWKRLRLGQIDHDEFYQQVFHGTSYAHLERDVRPRLTSSSSFSLTEPCRSSSSSRPADATGKAPSQTIPSGGAGI
jgi:hypothetical protein